jgi:hypothetical protein
MLYDRLDFESTQVPMPTVLTPSTLPDAQRRRISIGFINWAHALDH